MARTISKSTLFSRLSARLPLGLMGRAFHAVRVVPSTQDELRRLAEAGAPEGSVVVADHQTEGRGRQGRAWVDQPGANLLVSVLLRPKIPMARVPQLSLLAAVATQEALTASSHLEIRVRWPNDLEVHRRKVAGILAEASSDGRATVVMIGLGINVNQTEFPDLPRRATSLALEAGRMFDREALLEGLLDALNRWYTRYLRQGFVPVREAWLQSAHGLGGRITQGSVTGTAEGLDSDGALLVRTSAGEVIRLVAGELG
ncbi:MAG: biotin--[acetyl-CoA-carboxylase] ligase [Candidatus Methylomirabilia bacterium]